MSNCQFHGYDSVSCPMCKAERIASDADALSSGRAVIGVFAWTGANDYKAAKALKTYKSRTAAEKYAEKLNNDPLRVCANGYVARLVYV
jgi:hypothetical protein